jgi:hypothetical protein
MSLRHLGEKKSASVSGDFDAEPGEVSALDLPHLGTHLRVRERMCSTASPRAASP